MASTTIKGETFKLPRIRTRDELFKTSPEIAQFFGDVHGSDVLPEGRHAASPSATSRPGTGADSPRFLEDDSKEDDSIFVELEAVKKERMVLMKSIAQCKTTGDSAGGEAQENHVRQLLRELKLKKDKLNELRQRGDRREKDLAKLMNTSSDCEKLMLSDEAYLTQYVGHMNAEMHSVREDLIEMEAKNRLYTLLLERTRREHLGSEIRVRRTREVRDDCRDDVGTLSRVYHEMYSLKEDTDRQLNKLTRTCHEMQRDWKRKLKDRRKEVRSIRRAQLKDREIEARRIRMKRQKEASVLEIKMQKEHERTEMQARVKALMPKIASMEKIWNRLCTVSKATAGKEIVAFWNGLNEKTRAMEELVLSKEIEEKEKRQCLEELQKENRHLLDIENGSSVTTCPIARPSRSDRMETKEADRQPQKRPTQERALCVRVEQGLDALYRRLQKRGVMFDTTPSTIQERFQCVSDGIEQILMKASDDDEKLEVDAKAPGVEMPVGHKSERHVAIQTDLSRLVGYVDEDQDIQQRRRAARAKENNSQVTEGVMERGFLKARSRRFALRGSRRREISV